MMILSFLVVAAFEWMLEIQVRAHWARIDALVLVTLQLATAAYSIQKHVFARSCMLPPSILSAPMNAREDDDGALGTARSTVDAPKITPHAWT